VERISTEAERFKRWLPRAADRDAGYFPWRGRSCRFRPRNPHLRRHLGKAVRFSARRSGSQARRRTDAGRYLDVIKLLPYLVINEADVD